MARALQNETSKNNKDLFLLSKHNDPKPEKRNMQEQRDVVSKKKLHAMLEDASENNLEEIVSWQPGGKSFKVIHPTPAICNRDHANILQSIEIQILSTATQHIWLPPSRPTRSKQGRILSETIY
jgi:hypothetical protein